MSVVHECLERALQRCEFDIGSATAGAMTRHVCFFIKLCFVYSLLSLYAHYQCRTSACVMDGGDCDVSGCGEIGSLVYEAWTFHVGHDVYGINHSYICSELWDAGLGFAPTDAVWTWNCSYSLGIVDFNGDETLNFREFSVLVTAVSMEGFSKSGANFSDCIEMEHYNPYFG